MASAWSDSADAYTANLEERTDDSVPYLGMVVGRKLVVTRVASVLAGKVNATTKLSTRAETGDVDANVPALEISVYKMPPRDTSLRRDLNAAHEYSSVSLFKYAIFHVYFPSLAHVFVTTVFCQDSPVVLDVAAAGGEPAISMAKVR